MKRIIISVIIFLLCTAGAFAEVLCIGGSVDNYLAQIKSIDVYIEKNDFNTAAEQSKALEARWNKTLRAVDAVLIHDYVDQITISLAQMKSYAQSGNKDMYNASSETAKKSLESVRDSEYLFLENIL